MFRIARELHDSLLQGFQGMMFRLEAVRRLLPNRPEEAAAGTEIELKIGGRIAYAPRPRALFTCIAREN